MESIIDDALRKPSGEKDGEKGLFPRNQQKRYFLMECQARFAWEMDRGAQVDATILCVTPESESMRRALTAVARRHHGQVDSTVVSQDAGPRAVQSQLGLATHVRALRLSVVDLYGSTNGQELRDLESLLALGVAFPTVLFLIFCGNLVLRRLRK